MVYAQQWLSASLEGELMATSEAVQSRRFLFVLWDGGGNVPPQLAVARRLVSRGHQVLVLAPRVLEERIAAAGCQFVAYQRAPEHESASPDRDLIKDWAARTPLVRRRACGTG